MDGATRNVLLHVSYDGTDFHGWAPQPEGVRTVSGELTKAIETMVRHPVSLWGSSRTDVGVHARSMPVNFETTRTHIPMHGFLRGLNSLTPDDLGILSAELVDPSFRTRHEAVAKTYVYRYLVGRGRQPLLARTAWWLQRDRLDVDAMRAAAAHLLGDHDFAAFRSAHCDAKSTNRRIYRADMTGPDRDGLVAFEIVGNAFMRNMVRIIAGTLAEVGLGKRSADDLPRLLALDDRGEAGVTAPACGLTLTQVHFEGYPRLGKHDPTPADRPPLKDDAG